MKEGNSLPAGLAKPGLRALAGAGISHLEQFVEISEKEVRQMHGVGPKAMDIICTALEEQGLTFAKRR